MSTTRLSSRIPTELMERIDSSRQEMKEAKGIVPTRTIWVIEAIAEKLNREKNKK